MSVKCREHSSYGAATGHNHFRFDSFHQILGCKIDFAHHCTNINSYFVVAYYCNQILYFPVAQYCCCCVNVALAKVSLIPDTTIMPSFATTD